MLGNEAEKKIYIPVDHSPQPPLIQVLDSKVIQYKVPKNHLQNDQHFSVCKEIDDFSIFLFVYYVRIVARTNQQPTA